MDTLTARIDLPMAGVGDMQHAMRAELDVIAKQTQGDPLAQLRLLHDRLVSLGLVTDVEVKSLDRLAEIGAEVANEKRTAQAGYFESRGLLDDLLSSGTASPVALAVASSAVGTYTITEGPDGTITVARTSTSWADRGAAAGAIIGSAWGPVGGAIGGAIGGLVGGVVDECKK